MTPELIFILIVTFLTISFLLDQYLDYLNYQNRKQPIPDELTDVYNDQGYARQQQYKMANTRFGFISGTIGFIALLTFLLAGGLPFLDALVRQITVHPVAMALIFFGILMLASDIITTPFDIYQTFVIEERFGFNKTTLRLFLVDKIKGWLLGALIGGGLLAAIIALYQLDPYNFWIYALLVITGFGLLMNLFYSSLIVPLFNKQTPLPDGDLRGAIMIFAEKAKFRMKNIFVIDGSKRSTKANAYFAGIGSKKRIVLYDTLINDMDINEVVAVLAHEIGHYKRRHIWKGLFFSTLQTGITLFIFSIFIGSPILSAALGIENHSFHIGLIAFGMIYSPISALIGIIAKLYSRGAEFHADRFAKEYGLDKELISALKKLTRKNLSNLTPHPVYVFFNYSHPTLLQRIRAIKSSGGSQG
ncbi:MAG TPA: M48 family metallopeptidase [Bacteroidales bacterium]|nr:M48 family metallopeptidase [Bacteroidales bacterium]